MLHFLKIFIEYLSNLKEAITVTVFCQVRSLNTAWFTVSLLTPMIILRNLIKKNMLLINLFIIKDALYLRTLYLKIGGTNLSKSDNLVRASSEAFLKKMKKKIVQSFRCLFL